MKNKKNLAISIGVIIVSIATPLTIILLEESKHINKKLESKDINDKFDSDSNQRFGNKYFTNTETSLHDWGIKLIKVIKNYDTNYNEYYFWLEYLDYDFTNYEIKAKLFWSKVKLQDKNAQSKNVSIGGFAAPKTTFNENDKIQESEFANMFLPQRFTIPSTVSEIKSNAFKSAKGAIPSIPNTVKSIGQAVFADTIIPQGWKNPQAWETTIGENAYKGAILPQGFTIPSTVTEIKYGAFDSAKGAIPSIPNTVKKISPGVFSDTIIPQGWKNPEAWKKIIFQESYQGATLPQGFTIPDTVTEIQEHAFFRAKGAIPLILDNVSKFGDGVFSSSFIPKDWKNPLAWKNTIPSSSFHLATLPKGYKIPNTVTKIEKNAFLDVKIPNGTKWSEGAPIAGSQIVDK